MKQWRTLKLFVLVAALTLSLAVVASAQTRTLRVDVPEATGKPVPVSMSLDDVRRAVGIAFTFDWNSLRVMDAAGNPIPFQIDDVDLSGGLSRDDHLAFLTSGPARIEVSRVSDGDLPTFADAFAISETEEGWLVESIDGQVAAEVTRLGGVNLVRYNGVAGTYARDMGFVRYAGFPASTYWVNGDLKHHEEYTTLEEPMRVVAVEVLENSPVRATVVVKRASDKFPGLRQDMVIGIYTTGEVQVEQVVTSAGYADLTKMLTIVNAVMGSASDARHMLPAFRWLDWAEELGISAAEYWAERDALMNVDGTDYVAFAGSSGPAPLWWGASYIFASPERWRTNHSASQGVGVAEILLHVPEIAPDLRERLEGPQWQLEGEWRHGIFRWIADEIVNVRAERGDEVNLDTNMESGDWALHMIPGDTMRFSNYYAPYEAGSLADAARYVEQRYAELSGISVTLE